MKKKGCRTERELVHLFWDNGWSASRVAGSGSTTIPAPDIIAGKSGRVLVIECKARKESTAYLTKKEVEELTLFANILGAEPWIGVRFNNTEWRFIETSKTKLSRGDNHVITLDEATKEGLTFKDLTLGSQK